jgi:hypothetical protein
VSAARDRCPFRPGPALAPRVPESLADELELSDVLVEERLHHEVGALSFWTCTSSFAARVCDLPTWCATEWPISWARTPASWASSSVASRMPRKTKMNPGDVKAFTVALSRTKTW